MILSHPLQSFPTLEKRKEISHRSLQNDIYRIKPILSCRTNKNSLRNKKKYLISSPIHLSPVSMDVSTNTKGPMKGLCKTRRYVSNCTQTSEIEFEPIDLSVNTSNKNNRKSNPEINGSDDSNTNKANRKSVASVKEGEGEGYEDDDEYPQITPMHQLKLNKKDNDSRNDQMRRRRRKKRHHKGGSGYLLRNAINNRYMKLQKNKNGQFVDENGKVVEGVKEGEDGKILVEKVDEDGKVYYVAEGYVCDEDDSGGEEEKGEEEDYDDFDYEDSDNNNNNMNEDELINQEVKKCVDSMLNKIEREAKEVINNSLEARARNSILHLDFNYLNKLNLFSPTDSPMVNSPFLTPTNESDNDKKDRTEKCNKILSDPILRAFLKAYLTQNFQSESILFWEAIFELEDIEDKVTSSERVKYIKEVYDLFIKEGSKMEINIDHDLRKKIEDKINSKTDKVKVYTDAKDEIARLIITNNYENFKKTDLYKQAAAIEKWFSIYSKFDPDLKKAIAEQMSLVRQTVYVVPPPKEVVDQDNIIRRLIRQFLDFFQHLFGK